MAKPAAGSAGLPAELRELWELVLAYVRQETLEPLKGLARFLAFGLAGSLALGLGLVLMLLGGLRALQTETGDTFSGRLSWAPYLITLLAAAALAALALRGRNGRRQR